MRMIEVGKPARAWMTIGTAARLQAFRELIQPEPYELTVKDDNSRCFWSIFILERAFSCQLRTIVKKENSPSYPPSAPWPAPLLSNIQNDQALELFTVDEGVKDSGALTYCIQIISIWGDLNSYLHELRLGKVEKPWLPNSTNAQLVLQLYEYETTWSPKHNLRNACLSNRTISEFSTHQEYWTLWAFLQVGFHAVSAMLNHPFIHLVATNDSSRAPKPRHFLQKTIDLALFHSGWVARVLRIFDSFPFEINDPLVGHFVAATATILWFFQFVRDRKISSKAREDREKCEQFLERMSAHWPHIAQKVCRDFVYPIFDADVQRANHIDPLSSSNS